MAFYSVNYSNKSKNLRLNGHTSFEFQTRNHNTCSGHICMVLLAVRMVADVIETRIVISSLEFKTCMTIKS